MNKFVRSLMVFAVVLSGFSFIFADNESYRVPLLCNQLPYAKKSAKITLDLTKSQTACSYTISSCLVKAEDIIGKGQNWQATNDQQTAFLNGAFSSERSEVSTMTDIESIASFKDLEINNFLSARGFSIKLQPFNQGEFGVASVLDVQLKWQNRGEVTSILPPPSGQCPTMWGRTMRDRVEYPAVRIKLGHGSSLGFSVYRKKDSNLQGKEKISDLILELNTQDKDTRAYISVPTSDLETATDLLNYVQKIRPSGNPTIYEYTYTDFDDVGIVFPMIDLDQQVELKWLIGMSTKSGWAISQALGQNKLRINEVGARAQSAVAIGLMKTALPPKVKDLYVINQPFLFWIEKTGISRPLFAAYLTEDSWKKPASLDKN